ncbi:MAG: hemerythrin family protein [Nitrospirota bacterium]|nr:hemerythrin family protein [Nitrospirota bacterium]
MKNVLYIVWSDSNRLGIPIIDEQHRGIVSIINSLYYFIQKGRGEKILQPTLIMLEQHIHIHFETEESLMTEAGYPALEEHILLHKELARKTENVSREVFMDKDLDMMLKFLKEWWSDHINKEDRKYAPFLKKLTAT